MAKPVVGRAKAAQSCKPANNFLILTRYNDDIEHCENRVVLAKGRQIKCRNNSYTESLLKLASITHTAPKLHTQLRNVLLIR